ncbi:hypothetical protein JCM1840_001596 [Sporobolomyces johnsonii]
MSCAAIATPVSSPRLAHPTHRTSAPLASILRSRTPMNSPRSPAPNAAAARIGAVVADYFSAGNYEGSTRTPITTPAAVGALNSPRYGFMAGLGALDLHRLDQTLSGLVDGVASSPVVGGLSFAAAGSALSASSPAPPTPATSSLSARRRPSLRISDLPPLVMPDMQHLLVVPEAPHLARGDSDAVSTSSEETITARLEYAGATPGQVEGTGYLDLGEGLGLGFAGSSGGVGKRIPTPYPERKAWIEDGDVN